MSREGEIRKRKKKGVKQMQQEWLDKLQGDEEQLD